MMKHHERARLLQDEYYRIVGIRPSYPRSRVELQRLSKQIDDLKQGLREIEVQRAEREVIKDDDDEDPTLSLFLNYLERRKMQTDVSSEIPPENRIMGRQNSLTR